MFDTDAAFSMISRFCSLVVSSACAALCFTSLAGEARPALMTDVIKASDVKAAVGGWCDALLAISKVHNKSGIQKSKPLAAEVIDAAYAYQLGPVGFKPTWAKGDSTYRETREGAISYFVGDDPSYDDIGYAIGSPGSVRAPWVKCVPEFAVIQSFGNTANTSVRVHFEAADGYKSTADKTFGYIRDDDGNLRIIVHHSSTPFSGF